MYLLDTNIVSELRKPRPQAAVISWLESVDDSDLHISVVTLGEIQAGIEITREQDAAKAAEIEAGRTRSLPPTTCCRWMPRRSGSGRS